MPTTPCCMAQLDSVMTHKTNKTTFFIRRRKLYTINKQSRSQDSSFARRMKSICMNQHTLTYDVHVELLNKKIIVLQVSSFSSIGMIIDQIRWHQASNILTWPRARGRRMPKPSNDLLSEWLCPAALRISHHGVFLDDGKSLRELGLGPLTRLQAHMKFSQVGYLTIHPCATDPSVHPIKAAMGLWHPSKRTAYDRHAEDDGCGRKRQKYNDPQRNKHFHGAYGVDEKLEVSSRNAARYGMDVDDLEDLLDTLELAGDGLEAEE